MKVPGNYAAVPIEYVAQHYEDNTAVIVDARPKRPKFDKGHIPSAISIPDTQFDKLKGKLPADKATPLIFYCGGFT
jgi:rhodanese-related sulfurtransferase